MFKRYTHHPYSLYALIALIHIHTARLVQIIPIAYAAIIALGLLPKR